MSILFGDYIRKRRETLRKGNPGYSIRQVAKRIGIHHSYLSKVERGEPATLSDRTLIALAVELNEDPDLLMAMNGKLSENLRRSIFNAPELFPSFAKRLKAFPDKLIGNCEIAALRSMRQMTIMQIDTDMRIVWMKSGRVGNIAVQGRKCHKALFHSDTPCEGCPAKESMIFGNYKAAEVESANGDRWLACSTPLEGDDGKIIGSVNVGLDIARGRQYEVSRVEAEQLMLHDIRSPLSGIVGMLRSMYHDENLTSDQRELMTIMACSAEALMSQVAGALDIHLIESGQLQYQPTMVNLSEMLRCVGLGLSSSGRFKGVNLNMTIGGRQLGKYDSLWVRADSSMTHRMLNSLMVNAFEASKPGDTVHVALQNGSDVTIKVKNPAPIPLELKDRFFDKYVTGGKKGGLGLGTYGAKLIGEFMGGQIDLSSNEEEGTTLTVTLPSH